MAVLSPKTMYDGKHSNTLDRLKMKYIITDVKVINNSKMGNSRNEPGRQGKKRFSHLNLCLKVHKLLEGCSWKFLTATI